MVAYDARGANDFIEHEVHRRLKAIEQVFDADGLTIVAAIAPGLDDQIRVMIEEMKSREENRDRLVVLLTTLGGIMEIAKRIAETFRSHYNHVSFVIPNHAFSAGTVLAMSGDEIFMDYYSQLGPIDPQVQNASERWVPALGYLKQWERLLAKAEAGELTTAEAQLMIYGFDQAELYQYEQARELSITLLKEWLVKYKFKNWKKTRSRGKEVTPQMKKKRAEDIAKELNNTDRWHSHGSGITMSVLQDGLKLQIDDFDADPTMSRAIKEYDGLLSDWMQRIGFQGMLHTVDNCRPLV